MDKSTWNSWSSTIPAGGTYTINCNGGKEYIWFISYGSDPTYYIIIRFTRTGRSTIAGELKADYLTISASSGIFTLTNLKDYNYGMRRIA